MKDLCILRAFYDSVWAILPEKLYAIEAVIRRHAASVRLSAEEIAAYQADKPTVQRAGSLALIPIRGTIAQRTDVISYYSGGTSTERVGAQLRAAAEDPDVETIVLDVDSPGGQVYGVQELYAEIMAAREQKKIVASCNSLMASAAYWIASAAHEITMMPSGDVGSIGCIAIYSEFSKLEELAGITTTVIRSAQFKGELNGSEPLTDEAAAHLQSRVDACGAAFEKGVAVGRDRKPADVREHFGQGRVLMAKDALKVGMVDRIESFQETLSRLGKKRAKRSTMAAADRALFIG